MSKQVPRNEEAAEAIDEAGEILDLLEPFINKNWSRMTYHAQERLIRAKYALVSLTDGSDPVLWMDEATGV